MTKMQLSRAMALLGLSSFTSALDKRAVVAAWKRQIKTVHPDKCGAGNATQRTQTLNAAKDALLELLHPTESAEARRRREYAEELAAQAEELRRASALADAVQREINANHAAKLAEAREQRRLARRRKRAAAGAVEKRMHRRTQAVTENCSLMEAMERFIRRGFKKGDGHVASAAIMARFFAAREAPTTPLEERFFHRHCKPLFLRVWPHAKYKQRLSRWGFADIVAVAEAAA